MKKEIIHKIHEIAETLGPKSVTVCTGIVSISGEDALLSGFGQYPRAQEFKREEVYELETDVIVASTWEKELKRAYRRDGMTAITEIVRSEFKKRVLDQGIQPNSEKNL